ncbi:restriction endonuclease subunit S [Streptococcus suis]|nr:restriction endonuclease subunit S [Streptococcus suis]
MKTNNNIPAYRFQGYTDAWEQRKLGEVVYRSNLTSSSKDLPRLEFEDINSGLGTLNKDISQKVDDRKGLEFNEGDVLFGKLRPYLKNWWYAEFKGIALGDFWNLKSDLWHSCFLYTYIQSNSFQLVANDTSGTKMPRSDWNLVAESIAKFPTLPEQEAIGTFFSTLDRHITLHQCKLDTLKEQKKTYLKLLFPAKGQTKPALCFQGFEDDWEEVKLGEIVVWEKGSGLSKSDLNIEDRGGKVIHYADLYRYKEVITEIFHSSESIEGKAIPLNSLLFPMSDVTPQGLARASSISIEGVRAGGDILIANIKDNSSIFLSYQVNANYRYILPLVTGTTVRHISSTSLSTIPISLPSLPEQEAIGTFFQTLDQEIAQVEDKLASLKEMKKTLLRKLFV